MANDCLEILKQGIYEYHLTTRTENKDADYKHYFESEEFKNDFKNGKFNLGVDTVIYGAPVKLDFGSDDTQINEFQRRVKESTDFKVSNNFFLSSAEIIPNKDIIEAYKRCVEHKGFGFNISYETTENTITFRVYYSNLDVTQKPILEDVIISPSSKLVFQSIKKGEKILNNSESKYVFELAKDTKEVVFILDTDLTAVSQKAEIKRKGLGSGDLPVGTIVSSYLNWEQFQKTTENNKESGGFWKSESSYWSPCDGRGIPNSQFGSVASVSNVPDLRGVFLRGLNIFDVSETSSVPYFQADVATNRKIGSFQEDGIGLHNHEIASQTWKGVTTRPMGVSGNASGADGDLDGSQTISGYDKGSVPLIITSTGISESRPKNIAFYYYIKIN